jgi:hypothetical protein
MNKKVLAISAILLAGPASAQMPSEREIAKA